MSAPGLAALLGLVVAAGSVMVGVRATTTGRAGRLRELVREITHPRVEIISFRASPAEHTTWPADRDGGEEPGRLELCRTCSRAHVKGSDAGLACRARRRAQRSVERSLVRRLMPTTGDADEWGSLLHDALHSCPSRRARRRQRWSLRVAAPGAIGRAWMRSARASWQRVSR